MSGEHAIVGVWEVHAPEAPFPHHVMTFHTDGTLLQANPDAARAEISDSVGMGLWRQERDREGAVIGRFVTVSARRDTQAKVGRTEVTFRVEVVDDIFQGAADTWTDGRDDGGSSHTWLFGSRLRI